MTVSMVACMLCAHTHNPPPTPSNADLPFTRTYTHAHTHAHTHFLVFVRLGTRVYEQGYLPLVMNRG